MSVWKNRYDKLLNCYTNNSKSSCSVIKATNDICNLENVFPYLCSESVQRQLLFNLPLKKAAGADGIIDENLCFADHSIFHYLAIFLKSLLVSWHTS